MVIHSHVIVDVRLTRCARAADDRWRWPEGYVPPPALLQDERKMNLIAQLQREIDEDDADVVELARSTCLSLDKRLIYQ